MHVSLWQRHIDKQLKFRFRLEITVIEKRLSGLFSVNSLVQ